MEDLSSLNQDNINLKIIRLNTKHIKLKKEVEHLEKYAQYSSSARIRHQELKKEKLRIKELIEFLTKNSNHSLF